MINYKNYKYARLGNSSWMILYRTKDDYLKIYSKESEKTEAIPMELFNEINDYFMNSGYDYLNNSELFYAMKNNLNWMEEIDETNS